MSLAEQNGKEADQMLRKLLGTIRITGGLAATALALWGGWMLGTYLAEVALGERDFPWEDPADKGNARDAEVPLWKRKLSPISGG